jgi:hypothetical protein
VGGMKRADAAIIVISNISETNHDILKV